MVNSVIRICLEKKLVVAIVAVILIFWGIVFSPFDWNLKALSRDPVPVDAIPDIGENQQIVFTEWQGRSPQDMEDQVTYPLTVSLLGIPGVKTVRSYSMFGFSSIYVIFKEEFEFYWTRSRILEKLSSLPPGTLPDGVRPALGPDATALGQVFWYTLEGRDSSGQAAGGWDPQELRSIQDWQVRYSLMSVEGVSEVASVGGQVQEYQIDLDPDAMRAHDITLASVIEAVRMSNTDVGARTIEINSVEYVIRGLGFIKSLGDIEKAVVKFVDGVSIRVKDVARVCLGPALRRGALDKEGTEVVGGVVVARFGSNPLEVIDRVKARIAEISPGLPSRTLPDGRVSKVAVVPFYDRSGLIRETLGTLETALTEEVLVTIIVVLVMVMHLRSAFLISALLPVAVLACFIAMKLFKVDANVVALSGIAIAIGTIVDMGIVICENILRHLEEADPEEESLEVVYRATSEVGSAVLTAVSTTIVSFLPVFSMEAAEGKLFRPLAFTKTFALLASVVIALTIIPPAAQILFSRPGKKGNGSAGGLIAKFRKWSSWGLNTALILAVAILLARHWMPMGPEKGMSVNLGMVTLILGGLLALFQLFQYIYPRMLAWCLDNKALFLLVPSGFFVVGLMIWLGAGRITSVVPGWNPDWRLSKALSSTFPGLGKEFMPPLDEGSFLYMPSVMPHASIGEAIDIMRLQDISISAIPEVETAVGKLGRAESPLDPAPVSMIETTINYSPEFLVDQSGRHLTFKWDPGSNDLFRNPGGTPVPAPDGLNYHVAGTFARDPDGALIPDEGGKPFRLWRPPLDPDLNRGRPAWAGIATPDDIWKEILVAAEVPGATSAPKLQPISTRIVMLQSGMRAPMGVKVKGPDLASIERAALAIEGVLKKVPSVEPGAVFADRIVGKPYLEIRIDRDAASRYGIRVKTIQEVIEFAIGGQKITTTVEGRERYPVRVRFLRELRDSIEAIGRLPVPAPDGAQIPLIQMARIEFAEGPQVIKSEDTFLVGYVLFDGRPGIAEAGVVADAQAALAGAVASGEMLVPKGVSFAFTGTYENQVRSEKRLTLLIPFALMLIFLILYLQFGSVLTTGLVFTGIGVALSGGFLMIWLYGRPWFLDFALFGVNMRDLFGVHTVNLSVAIWVGFLALFGIATDDGVVMTTYLDDSFRRLREKDPGQVSQGRPCHESESKPQPASANAAGQLSAQGDDICADPVKCGETRLDTASIRAATVAAGTRRIRPCLMTTATTILALLPVLTSSGRGSDIMVPMAIPSFGGMAIEVMTMLVVPVLYCLVEEVREARRG